MCGASALLQTAGQIREDHDADGEEDVDDGKNEGHVVGIFRGYRIGWWVIPDYSSSCIQPLTLSLSSALTQTLAITSCRARMPQAATKPTMARPLIRPLPASSSSSSTDARVAACDGVLRAVAGPSGWVGGCRLTVALGKVAVEAPPGMSGLVAGAPIGAVDVASLMVGAAVPPPVFNGMVGAGVAVGFTTGAAVAVGGFGGPPAVAAGRGGDVAAGGAGGAGGFGALAAAGGTGAAAGG